MTRKFSVALFGLGLLGLAATAAAGNGVSLSVIHTGNSAGGLESTMVAGGSWLRWRKLVMTAVLIRHPHGDLMLDTGFGSRVDEHFAQNSWFEKQLLKYENARPVTDQLRDAGVALTSLKAIIPTHMHWDHVDALEDFPGVPVWVEPAAVAAARSLSRPAYIAEQFDDPGINWMNLDLRKDPYRGFARSRDVFGDGSVVLVDLSGHTASDVGAFVTLDSGRRYLFVGDLSWTRQGVERNSPRPWFVNSLMKVDVDETRLSEALSRVHRLSASDPDLIIVPAHDEQVAAQMARFPNFEN